MFFRIVGIEHVRDDPPLLLPEGTTTPWYSRVSPLIEHVSCPEWPREPDSRRHRRFIGGLTVGRTPSSSCWHIGMSRSPRTDCSLLMGTLIGTTVDGEAREHPCPAPRQSVHARTQVAGDVDILILLGGGEEEKVPV